jgi:hypothetical protein
MTIKGYDQGTLCVAYNDQLDWLIVLAKQPQGVKNPTAQSGAFDDRVTLLYDAEGGVVGCDIQGAKDMGGRAWYRHPDRALIPLLILQALDQWFDHQAKPDSLVQNPPL